MKPEPTLLSRATQIACAAQDFLAAAQRCGTPGRDDHGGWLSEPQVVNCAFAIELALKGLHVICSGKKAHGHDLDKLFGRLPEEVQHEIRQDMHEPLFLEHLRKVRSAFEEWRYTYEVEEIAIDYGFLEWMATRAIRTLQQKTNISP